MATYRVQGPDGATYRIEGPEGATDEQLISAVQDQIAQGEVLTSPFNDTRSIVAKDNDFYKYDKFWHWDGFNNKYPEETSVGSIFIDDAIHPPNVTRECMME